MDKISENMYRRNQCQYGKLQNIYVYVSVQQAQSNTVYDFPKGSYIERKMHSFLFIYFVYL